MARGRMLLRSISTDDEVDDLINEFGYQAGLLVTWMIPFLDCEGRMTGNPKAVRALVVPMRFDFDTEQVEKILQAANDHGVLVWYSVEGRRYVWFPAFDECQTGLRKDKEQPSKIPPPPDADPPAGGAKTKKKKKGSKESNDGGAEEAPPLFDPEVSNEDRAELARRKYMPDASPQVVAAMVRECPAVDVAKEIWKSLEWVREHPNRKPKNWDSYVRKWMRKADGRPEGGNQYTKAQKNGPKAKPAPTREEIDAANAELLEEQRERLGF